ncbi:hypothetical protein [Lactobacillus selangorensis]|nr:hypothetical protein [Lactobacillus selangorensis]
MLTLLGVLAVISVGALLVVPQWNQRQAVPVRITEQQPSQQHRR